MSVIQLLPLGFKMTANGFTHVMGTTATSAYTLHGIWYLCVVGFPQVTASFMTIALLYTGSLVFLALPQVAYPLCVALYR